MYPANTCRVALALSCLWIVSCTPEQPPRAQLRVPWTTRTETPITVVELLDRIRLLREHRQNPQVLLRDATHECRRAMLDLPWAKVESQLREQGIKCLSSREFEYFSSHEYLLLADAWTTAGGAKSDLIVSFGVNRQPVTNVWGTRAGFVSSPAAGLRFQLDRPYVDVIEQGVFDKFPAVSRALAVSEIADNARQLPYLTTVAVRYDFLFDRWEEHTSQGFFLNVELAEFIVHSRRGACIYCSVVSGLDCPLDIEGRVAVPCYQPQDSLEEARFRGSNGGTQE